MAAADPLHPPGSFRLRCPAHQSAPRRKSPLRAATQSSHSALSASPWSNGDTGPPVIWLSGPPIGATLISPGRGGLTTHAYPLAGRHWPSLGPVTIFGYRFDAVPDAHLLTDLSFRLSGFIQLYPSSGSHFPSVSEAITYGFLRDTFPSVHRT